VTTSELHVVDLETGMARDLGRIGTEARSPVWWQTVRVRVRPGRPGRLAHRVSFRRTRAWFDRWLRDEAPDGEP